MLYPCLKDKVDPHPQLGSDVEIYDAPQTPKGDEKVCYSYNVALRCFPHSSKIGFEKAEKGDELGDFIVVGRWGQGEVSCAWSDFPICTRGESTQAFLAACGMWDREGIGWVVHLNIKGVGTLYYLITQHSSLALVPSKQQLPLLPIPPSPIPPSIQYFIVYSLCTSQS